MPSLLSWQAADGRPVYLPVAAREGEMPQAVEAATALSMRAPILAVFPVRAAGAAARVSSLAARAMDRVVQVGRLAATLERRSVALVAQGMGELSRQTTAVEAMPRSPTQVRPSPLE